jgi:SAM-dependent methyltransferase
MRDIEDRHWWFRGRRRIVAAQLRRMGLGDGARILDLGCGTGGNLRMLAQFGDVTGVEMDSQALRLAGERGVAPVLGGSLPSNIPFGAGSFDCVTMLDVLEHVEQDAAGLASVHDLLTPGGRLLLTVPAFRFLWGPHDEEHHHHRRYRAKELRSKLRDTGFAVEHLTYFNTWLFPPIAAVRLLHQCFPAGKPGLETGLPPAWLNRLLLGLFASERLVVTRGRLPFGVSLLAVARKAPTGAG